MQSFNLINVNDNETEACRSLYQTPSLLAVMPLAFATVWKQGLVLDTALSANSLTASIQVIPIVSFLKLATISQLILYPQPSQDLRLRDSCSIILVAIRKVVNKDKPTLRK
jgi:hypothetical protein